MFCFGGGVHKGICGNEFREISQTSPRWNSFARQHCAQYKRLCQRSPDVASRRFPTPHREAPAGGDTSAEPNEEHAVETHAETVDVAEPIAGEEDTAEPTAATAVEAAADTAEEEPAIEPAVEEVATAAEPIVGEEEAGEPVVAVASREVDSDTVAEDPTVSAVEVDVADADAGAGAGAGAGE